MVSRIFNFPLYACVCAVCAGAPCVAKVMVDERLKNAKVWKAIYGNLSKKGISKI